MAKETKDLEPIAKTKKTSTKKAATTAKKSAIVAKKTATKRTTTSANKTATRKKSSTKKVATTAKKDITKKATATTKKAATKKSTSVAKKTTAKKTTTKKTATTARKTATRKTTTKKSATVAKKVKFQAEYYDLPYIYNKTIVKVLAQTPKMLFIYWEISEDDRNLFKKIYGENFFNNTKPILIVYNDTLNYSFEVEIDDFANSWYLHIDDANCEYHIELGRKPVHPTQQQNQAVYLPYYVYVTSSNEMASPNNAILFNPNYKEVKFRNVKTGEITLKDIKQFTFITNFGLFNIKDLYKFLFPNESFEFENIVLGNTSSGSLSSSGIFSSQFK